MTKTTQKLKVFISYSREDLQFTEQLVRALKYWGFEPLLDREDIDAAEAWKKRLSELVFSCDTVLFVLSAQSARSPICIWEVELAASLKKRMIPLLPAPLIELEPPPQLAELNYIYFYPEPKTPGTGVFDGLIKLDRALRVDLRWLREATRMSEAAAVWIDSGQTEARLLGGAALEDAEAWRARTPSGTQIQSNTLAFLRASRESEIRRKAEAEAVQTQVRSVQTKLENKQHVLEALREMDSENMKTRLEAACRLRKLQDPDTIPRLVRIISDASRRFEPPEAVVCSTLRQFGEAAVPPLIDQVRKDVQLVHDVLTPSEDPRDYLRSVVVEGPAGRVLVQMGASSIPSLQDLRESEGLLGKAADALLTAIEARQLEDTVSGRIESRRED